MTKLHPSILLTIALFAPTTLAQTADPPAADSADERSSVAVAAPTQEGRLAVTQRSETTLPGSNSQRDRLETRRWYGWQSLAVDGAVLLTTMVGAGVVGLEDTPAANAFGIFSVAAFVLGGPVVHASHDNWGRAAGSLALRSGAPVTFALIGMELDKQSECSPTSEMCIAGRVGGFIAGAVLGIATAVAVDSAVLARDTVHPAPSIVPAAMVNRDSAWIGATGTF